MSRTFQYLRRQFLKWLGYAVPSRYAPRYSKDQAALSTGYLLIDYISRGKMLSETWQQRRHETRLRQNLFHGLSSIMLNLIQTPLPKIGSLILDEHGYLCLNNRPLTLHMHFLENEQIQTDIPRDFTYSTTDSYINDVIAFHESRLRHQPNAVNDTQDGLYQVCALTVMRSIWSCFFRRGLCRGPFFLNLTDLHQSNIFVDDDWNIECLIDLEWACSLPAEMIHPPYWLTNKVSNIDTLDEYDALREEFMKVFQEEENTARFESKSPLKLQPILQQGWEQGTFWYTLALKRPTILSDIFYDHIQPRFSGAHKEESFWLVTMSYWTFETYKFVQQKVKEREEYDMSLCDAFKTCPSPKPCMISASTGNTHEALL